MEETINKTEEMTNEEIDKNWDKARAFLNILKRKAIPVITEKTKEFTKSRRQDDFSLLNGAFLMELVSDDGYVLRWSRRHYTSYISHDDYGLDLTLISPQGEKMYEMSFGHIGYPKFPNCFSVLDEYMDIASKLQFTNVKIIGDNSVLKGIGTFCNRYLGIKEEEYHPEILSYSLNSPYEGNMTVNVNGYLINIHMSLLGEKSDEINCYRDGDTIDQTRLCGYCGWDDAYQSLVVNCGESSFIQLNTSPDCFEIAFTDRSKNLQRNINLSLGQYHDECRGRLKEFSISDNYKEILRVSYKNSEVVGTDYDFDLPIQEKNNVKRYYEAVIGSESTILTERDASCILYHPEIKDFILYVIGIVKERYPNLADRMFEHFEFSTALRPLIKNYEKDFLPNDIAREIVDKAIENGQSSGKILKLIKAEDKK